MNKSLLVLSKILCILCIACSDKTDSTPIVSIAPWKGDKQGAVSITFDDNSINQFKVAMPILDELNIKATYYVITGKIPDSKNREKFVGRNIDEIIRETEYVLTNEYNVLERASAIRFEGKEGLEFHIKAGALIDEGSEEKAYQVIDEGFQKIRQNRGKGIITSDSKEKKYDLISWKDYKNYAKAGHEIASHTVSHPRLVALDTANLLYELEKSREDILANLGIEYTFSMETPFGSTFPRVVEYTQKIYPAVRSSLSNDYIDEINSSNHNSPIESQKEYVKWVRTPVTTVSLVEMKSWVDQTVSNDKIWLVLVFHGVDGIGWEARSSSELKEYFTYIKGYENVLWISTMADITKYVRERMNTIIDTFSDEKKIQIKTHCSLNPCVYNSPITLKVQIPRTWKEFTIKNLASTSPIKYAMNENGGYVLFDVSPYNSFIVIKESKEINRITS